MQIEEYRTHTSGALFISNIKLIDEAKLTAYELALPWHETVAPPCHWLRPVLLCSRNNFKRYLLRKQVVALVGGGTAGTTSHESRENHPGQQPLCANVNSLEIEVHTIAKVEQVTPETKVRVPETDYDFENDKKQDLVYGQPCVWWKKLQENSISARILCGSVTPRSDDLSTITEVNSKTSRHEQEVQRFWWKIFSVLFITLLTVGLTAGFFLAPEREGVFDCRVRCHYDDRGSAYF